MLSFLKGSAKPRCSGGEAQLMWNARGAGGGRADTRSSFGGVHSVSDAPLGSPPKKDGSGSRCFPIFGSTCHLSNSRRELRCGSLHHPASRCDGRRSGAHAWHATHPRATLGLCIVQRPPLKFRVCKQSQPRGPAPPRVETTRVYVTRGMPPTHARL